MVTGFIELVTPPVDLVIAGAGNDAFPLVEMSGILGWHTTIVDGRKTHANTQRFPTAKKVVVSKPAEAVPQLNINEQSIIVLMSHNYNYDLGMLRQLDQIIVQVYWSIRAKEKIRKDAG